MIMSKIQQWIPAKYKKNADFVAQLGMPVINLLAPQAGEYILDLGCGDGTLMQKLAELGCQVLGIDSSAEMVKTTQELGLKAQIMNGEELNFREEFDAVFSNAALHWMTKADAVIQGVFQALKPGGRFAGELGGAGNVATVVNAIDLCLQRRGLDLNQINPWFFPEPEDYQHRLEKRGFIVQSITMFERPTLLPQGIVGWLEMFAQQFTAQLPLEDRPLFIQEVTELCQPQLCDEQGNWIADYVRLRFLAVKPLRSL
jgi:trans-aconitate methyltransferase